LSNVDRGVGLRGFQTHFRQALQDSTAIRASKLFQSLLKHGLVNVLAGSLHLYRN
jgi:hypothetical protein